MNRGITDERNVSVFPVCHCPQDSEKNVVFNGGIRNTQFRKEKLLLFYLNWKETENNIVSNCFPSSSFILV